jgi:FkbM family methyltransferase
VRVRELVGRQARRHPRVVYQGARVIDRLGVDAGARALERAADVVTVRPPMGRSFAVHGVEGRDQIANAFRSEGWRSFERPLPDVFARVAGGTDGVIVDVGANTGFYALLATAVASRAPVVAFEPYPPAAAILRENVRLNFARRIQVFPLALGREPGTASLHVPDPEHGLVETSASLNHEFRDEGVTSAVEVEVTTLDLAMTHETAAVGLVKIDVESTEHDVLVGGETVIARDRPVIVLEVLPLGDLEGLESFRDRHGYVDIRLRPDAAVVGDHVHFDPDAWNHVWAPKERLDVVLAACRASHLLLS